MHISLYRTTIWLFCCFTLCRAKTEPEVLLVIACPPYPRQAQDECFALAGSVREQHRQLNLTRDIALGNYVVKVHVMHELFNYWTLLDALPHLQSQTSLVSKRTEWIIWCQHNTQVASLRDLLKHLRYQDHDELAFYGHALYDSEATIIHHFWHYKDPRWFPYPMLSAGLVFTGSLFRRLTKLVALNAQNNSRPSEFSIDASHELARFIFDNIRPDDDGDHPEHRVAALSRKIILKNVPYICPMAITTQSPKSPTRGAPSCALYAKPKEPYVPGLTSTTLGDRKKHCVHTTGSHIYFAIKTCAKFHKERIPIIERTWATDTHYRRYYSDVADDGIPTISTGIPNVQTGHCAKTMAILQLSLKDIGLQSDIRWLMLVDDDTLLSVPRVSALLSCHNHSELVYVGQRYGYRLHAPDGFNYHTGGAGILLSLPLVRLIVDRCSCPSASAPDDMILGYCLQVLGVPAVPAAGMHQARSQDYAMELLQLEPPVSFHKFWGTEPDYTYSRWLGGKLGNRSAPLTADRERSAAAPAASVHLLGRLPVPGGGVLPLEAVLESSGKHLDL
ncbi:beta-1,3-glucosyltransferase [Drosophila kikkawai]|uniref:Beta-1,3-glucosyltransferase n=1 Tax=Drosophila kikkawai TaxID=30033 RepID=A0A6P4IJS4_DROKI|nr:beta-1,3-glucosyltransferase [Drosophila kikkawai]